MMGPRTRGGLMVLRVKFGFSSLTKSQAAFSAKVLLAVRITYHGFYVSNHDSFDLKGVGSRSVAFVLSVDFMCI